MNDKLFSKIKQIFNYLLPYIIILIASLFGTYLVFYNGLNVGDDFYFHLPNILDSYKSIVDGHGLNAISGNLAMGVGVGNRLFYSPLSHFTVVIFTFILGIFGGSIISSFKTTIVLSVFISGIFMYRFALHFTKNNKIAALISALVFVLYPYRLFNAFCRLAFAEAYAIMFTPLFFMGLYDITHIENKDDLSVIPFVEIILGGGLLYLSHNITGLYFFIFGILYLLLNINRLIKLFKNYKYIIYCGTSVLLLVGISSIALFSQFELMNTGLYNLSHSERMWTTLEQVTGRLNEGWNFSGFLNIIWLSNVVEDMSISSYIIGMLIYFVCCFIFVMLDYALREFKILKKYFLNLIISGVVLLVLVRLISYRLESLLGAILFYIIYIYLYFTKDKENSNEDKIYKNKLFWYSLFCIFLVFYMIVEDGIWNIVPQIMLNIQFPWRLWSVVQLFAAIMCGLIVYYFNAKNFSKIAMASLVGFLMVSNMPLYEKRLMHNIAYESNWRLVIDDSYLDEGTALGFNKEYIPQVFLDYDYESEYKNSLYYKLRNKLPYSFHDYEDYKYSPVILSGEGKVEVNECFAPNYDMTIDVNEDSLIQMPLIYYPGYKIIISDLSTNESIEVEGENIDGLIAFNIKKGSYKVTTEYPGTTLRRTSFVIFYISIFSTGLILIYGLFFERKVKELIKKKD